MVKIYLAARYSRHPELRGYAADVRALGHEVTSRWIEGNHQMDDAGLSTEAARSERERFAREDYEDVCAADLLIAFTAAPRTSTGRGGVMVELGIAIGREMRTWIVGPDENVFCCLPWIARFEDWAECLAYLASKGERTDGDDDV